MMMMMMNWWCYKTSGPLTDKVQGHSEYQTAKVFQPPELMYFLSVRETAEWNAPLSCNCWQLPARGETSTLRHHHVFARGRSLLLLVSRACHLLPVESSNAAKRRQHRSTDTVSIPRVLAFNNKRQHQYATDSISGVGPPGWHNRQLFIMLNV